LFEKPPSPEMLSKDGLERRGVGVSANPLNLDNYFVGTNSQSRHVEEAYYRHIIAEDETLLGIFDGVFLEENGTRIGGIAVNDFLIITDKKVILWARDQFKDVVDAFPLTHVAPGESVTKDSLFGSLKLYLIMPNVPEEDVSNHDPVTVVFDLIPLADLNLVVGMLDVLTSLNREMCAAQASKEERAKATQIIFQQTFVNTIPATAKVTHNQPPPPAPQPEPPLVPEVDEDDLMTPLSRLDALDGFNAKPKSKPMPLPPPSTPSPVRGSSRQPNTMPEYADAQFYQAGEDINPPPVQPRQNNGHATAAIEDELNWLKSQTTDRRHARREARQPQPRMDMPTPSAPRFNAELNPDSVYTVGRVGRAAFDVISKLKKEGEKSAIELIPQLNPFKESGLTVREMTDLLTAVSGLMETLNRNPAAREIAMSFMSRAFPGAVKLDKDKLFKKNAPLDIEDADEGEELPVADANQKAKLKVERRNGSATPPPDFLANPVKQKVSIRRSGQATEEVATEEEILAGAGEMLPTRSPRRIMVRSAEPVLEAEKPAFDLPENLPLPEVPLDTITIISEGIPMLEVTGLEEINQETAEEVVAGGGKRKIGVRNA
jgi:hypothetical protein